MRQEYQLAKVNRMKSHEIGQLTIDNWQRILYRCQRATDKVVSDFKHGRRYEEVQCIEWTSPEGVLFWLFMDYRHQIPVLIPCIVGGTKERPQFLFPQNYLDTDGVQMDLYTCHFMERYRDRQMKTKLKPPMQEIVKRYAINNISSVCIWHNEDRSRRVCAVKQGLVFAKADRTYNRQIFTTYVSNEMLGEAQRESKAVVKQLLDVQDRLFNGTERYHQLEWDMLDVYITERLKQLHPLAQEIYSQYYEDAEEEQTNEQ